MENTSFRDKGNLNPMIESFYRKCMSSYQLPKTEAHFDSCIRFAFLNSFVAEMKRAFMLGNLLGSRKMRVPFLKVRR